jgi:hypothetical protein
MKSRIGLFAWLVVLAAALSIGVACTKATADSDVTGEVQSKINADSGLQSKQLTVQTSDGVVTLSGTVDNDAERTAASRYASSVKGVKQVVNDLQVAAPAAEMAPEAPEVPAPAEPVRRAEKPRPSMPRESTPRENTPRASANRPRSEARESEVASARPAPAVNPVQDSRSTSNSASPPNSAAPAVPPPPPPVKKVTLPSGTSLAIRLVDAIDSETAQAGQTFKATLDSPLSVDGDVVLPAGYDVQGHVVDVKSAGKFAGKSELVLQLDRIMVGPKSYSIQTDQYRREGSSRGKNTAEKVGAGAAIGAIIGGIAGGGKGAAIGAAAGGGLGGGVQAATKSQQIRLPSETVINFSLQSSVTVTPSDGPNPGRHKLETATPTPPAPENMGPQN